MYIDVASGQPDWREIYALCLGFVNPRPIALVSTVSPGGQLNLAPFSFYNLVSAQPPVLMFSPSVRHDRRRKDTLANIESTGQFVVASVTDEIIGQAVNCAAELPFGHSEFEFSGLTPEPATRVQPPLVQEAKVNLECALRQIVSFGDDPGGGNVIFGDIVAIHLDDRILDKRGRVDPHRLHTVGRLGGRWYCTVTAPYQMRIPEV
jgi:flavin reductase (DIM6/NTAB) family NADH-FMN oxidoreductase RutF